MACVCSRDASRILISLQLLVSSGAARITGGYAPYMENQTAVTRCLCYHKARSVDGHRTRKMSILKGWRLYLFVYYAIWVTESLKHLPVLLSLYLMLNPTERKGIEPPRLCAQQFSRLLPRPTGPSPIARYLSVGAAHLADKTFQFIPPQT